MLLKIGIGMVVMILGVCSILGIVVTAYIKFKNKYDQKLTCFFNTSTFNSQEEELLSVWWLVVPYSLVSLAEILINVSSKFAYKFNYFCLLDEYVLHLLLLFLYCQVSSFSMHSLLTLCVA